MERPSASATATPPSPARGMAEFPTTSPTPFNPPPFNPPGFPPAQRGPFTPAAPSGASGAVPFVPSQPQPASPVPPRPAPPVTPARSASVSPTPSSVPAPSPAAAESSARRPLNPFLSKDPNQRAKRLARALVSDIVTYQPAKHAEGLRDGTLKQLFREEIKKSFEEYIAQVGQQLAESTTYFQEALNEVLGAGKKIF
ncbi:MAG TPA: hypothetical protein VGD02_03505 [Gemmatimonadaceae bacterium]